MRRQGWSAEFAAWLDALAAPMPHEPLRAEEAWLATADGWVRIADPADGPAHRIVGPDVTDAVAALAAEVRCLASSLDSRHAPPSPAEYLTASEAAQYARMSRKALYQAARRGLIPFRRIGRSMKFSRKALDAVLAAR